MDRSTSPLTDLMGYCRTRVTSLLDEASALSEREVLEAGCRIGEMRREVQATVQCLDAVMSLFAEGGRGTLEMAVRRQAEATSRSSARLDRCLTEQHDATQAVIVLSTKIAAFVATIDALSSELRILTLNARLEAARWGQSGAAFGTVASSMTELTGAVCRANEQIGTLASDLSKLSSRIGDNERVMVGIGEEMNLLAEKQTAELLSAYDKARYASTHALDETSTKARVLLAASDGLLSNLQFQDRMKQILTEACNVVKQTEGVTAQYETERTGDSAADEGRMAALRARSGNAAVRLTGESELDGSDRGQKAGVVELF